MLSDDDAAEEVALVANILQRLTSSSETESIRKDQIDPLVARLKAVSTSLMSAKKKSQRAAAETHAAREGGNNTMESVADDKHPKTTGKKPSSLLAKKLPRATPPKEPVRISKEVYHAITCTLYNVLESCTNLVGASSSSIFIRSGDEMISIANVSTNLTFPPQLIRHRCAGSDAAEVLGSGIALSRFSQETSSTAISLLLLPIYEIKCGTRGQGLGTLQLEGKFGGAEPFSKNDEAIALLGSFFIGEIMSRLDDVAWLNNFYDPITQHILSPFVPQRKTLLPPVRPELRGTASTTAKDAKSGEAKKTAAIEKKMLERVLGTEEEYMVRRELPDRTGKQKTTSALEMPTLREVRMYVENMQDCWKQTVSANVSLKEEERGTQIEIKMLRRELRDAQMKLERATERLRLYELQTDNYADEYRNLAEEVTSYAKKRDKFLM